MQDVAEIWRQNHSRVRGVLYRMTKDPVLADDLTQDVALTLLTKFDQFESRASVSTWLYAIARRAFLMHARRLSSKTERFQGHYDDPVWQLIEKTIPDDYDVEAYAGARETLKRLNVRLKALRAKLRRALILCASGASKKDAANQMNITESAYSSLIYRGRIALGRFKNDRGFRC